VSDLSEFERGVIVGLLVGQGSFGGDGKQPQVTLRMHTRHEALFRWLMQRFPETRLYGPYHHGGRSYYQWMARGTTLVRDVLPLLESRLHTGLDGPFREEVRRALPMRCWVISKALAGNSTCRAPSTHMLFARGTARTRSRFLTPRRGSLPG